MKKKVKAILVITLALVMALSTCMAAYASTTNFILDTDGEMLPIPDTYTVTASIKNLGDAGSLSKAEDIFYKDGYLYVADTGNNRVLKMTTSGSVELEVTSAGGTDFNGPKGVFVDDDGQIWVADTGNLRIAVVDAEGNDVNVYTKPDSDALSDITFDIEKVVVNNMGYIFALKGANVIKMNSSGEFLGYMAATDVGFSFTRFLIKTFGTKAQQESTEKQEPTPYNNITIGLDGDTYGVLSEGDSGQIRRLNSVGDNIYPEQAYGYTMYAQGSLTPITAAFIDVTADENGIVTVLDQNTGLIYQYDTEGNLLTTFGGIGNRKGMFSVPCSIVVDESGNLYVLDNNANNIQVFAPTNFIELVHTAITLQADGDYDNAKEYWQDVLDIDSNYSLAHVGLGKILYKEGNYTESMYHYKQADDTEGYSNAFSAWRHDILRDYFFLIVAIVVVIVVILGKLFVYIKQKADRWSFNIELRGDMDK